MRLAVAVAAGALCAATATPLAGQEPVPEHSILAPLAPRSLLLDGALAGDRLVAVGERGHVLLSDDHGQSWRQVVVPTRAMLTGVCFFDRSLGWAVGHDESILRTRDGGETWQLVHYAPENERPLLDVWCGDAGHGVAVGAYGALLVSDDGGESWRKSPIGSDDFHLNQIAAATDGTLYLAAEAGNLYRSEDRGASWEDLTSPYDGSFFGALPLSDGALLAFGLRGNLYRSDDRGESWSALETGTEATLMAGIELSGDRVLIAGLAGTLLRSADGGRSFTRRVFEDRRGHVAIVASHDVVLLLGEGGARRLEAPR